MASYGTIRRWGRKFDPVAPRRPHHKEPSFAWHFRENAVVWARTLQRPFEVVLGHNQTPG